MSTAKRGGTLLVPVFAVGRAQLLLHLAQLRHDGRIPGVPTFLNSPMATAAADLFCDFPNEHRLTAEQCAQTCDGVEYSGPSTTPSASRQGGDP